VLGSGPSQCSYRSCRNGMPARVSLSINEKTGVVSQECVDGKTRGVRLPVLRGTAHLLRKALFG
jgi:hypothetical protein